MNDPSLLEQIRQTIDDSVLTHTGRSVGDLASERVARDVLALPALRAVIEQAQHAAHTRRITTTKED